MATKKEINDKWKLEHEATTYDFYAHKRQLYFRLGIYPMDLGKWLNHVPAIRSLPGDEQDILRDEIENATWENADGLECGFFAIQGERKTYSNGTAPNRPILHIIREGARTYDAVVEIHQSVRQYVRGIDLPRDTMDTIWEMIKDESDYKDKHKQIEQHWRAELEENGHIMEE